jgi:phosphoglycolate phosphatase
MLKHIIFDFDGTIADSSDIGVQIFNELSEKYNYKKLTREELILVNNRPIKERLKHIGVPLYRLPGLIMDAQSRYRLLLSLLKNFAGMKELFETLTAEGFSLSIISSNSAENIESFLKSNGLNYFDNIISVNNLFGKHIALRKFLKKNKLKGSEIIYIGDELRDIQACKKIPVRIITVSWGYDSLDLLKSGDPDFISDKPEDILKIIQEINQISST